MKTEKQIFWEKQQDLMCGVHCLNSLLQGRIYFNLGPFYNPGSLAEIALEFDAK